LYSAILDFLDLELDSNLSSSFILYNVAAYKAMNFCISTFISIVDTIFNCN
jgi:hypothetical protein